MSEQIERLIAEMRDACRMPHVEGAEPEPAIVASMRIQREEFLADVRRMEGRPT